LHDCSYWRDQSAACGARRGNSSPLRIIEGIIAENLSIHEEIYNRYYQAL
jgi:hypothetical protein